MKVRLALGGLLLSSLLCAESIDEALDGFDDVAVEVEHKSKNTSEDTSEDVMDGFDDSSEEISAENNEQKSEALLEGFDDENSTEVSEEKTELIAGFTGKITEQLAYSYNGKKPHNNLTSIKSSLFLDYEHKFENGWRVKTNAKAYYDAIYDVRDEKYSRDELDEQRSEIELFDAYVEGSITENLDMKLGRQVVVWGRSDTIRITDVLNPLDNRRPGMVDIEDLRLPVNMAKFDFFWGDWRVTPIAILENRFSKNPAFGSAFNPVPNPHIDEKKYSDINYALSVGGEFSGWDVNFYAARIRDDAGYVKFSTKPTYTHDKVSMLGTALNVLSGSWLFKAELAYFNGLKYTTTLNENFKRTDILLGAEYKGIADALISYDISLRHLNNYDTRLLNERNPLEKDTYQHAFRVSSDFMNATLTANYLISLFGKKLDEGGFQRAWVKYELGEGINMNVGLVDYIGGSKLFDSVRDNDMVFVDISYSF
ncbi:MAG: DUF1302 family protein [Sulfurovum sp.]|nr:DUF1302 family protein [Sulfurovum sp.]